MCLYNVAKIIREYVLKKECALNSGVRLITRVYGIYLYTYTHTYTVEHVYLHFTIVLKIFFFTNSYIYGTDHSPSPLSHELSDEDNPIHQVGRMCVTTVFTVI